ncbi:MAG: ankyrin repeat domain-containing protein [Patescibacteria group bacterium]|nr:ankyrin repeat domain-containing protein [Patescibacteria group bacterium]
MSDPIDADGYYTAGPYKGWHRLHAAVHKGDISLVRAFLAAGDKCNLWRKGNGGTPLLTACCQGNVAVAALLLEHKADVNQCDLWGAWAAGIVSLWG